MNIKEQKKSGISLIVLVITIIVMIILAAAIILSLDGSNIIERANEAKYTKNDASAKEIILLAHSKWLLMEEAERKDKGDFSSYASMKLEEANINSEDYIISENGKYDLCVAKIGEERYSSLNAALEKVLRNTETTIVLNRNTNEKISLNSRHIITLDLNGYNISTIGTAIVNSGTLTIKDSSIGKTGKIKAVSDKSLYNEACDFNSNGVVDTDDLKELLSHYTEKVDENNKKYDLDNSGVIALDDMLILLNYVNSGYAISNSGELIIENISKDKFTGEPLAIYNDGGTVEGYQI